MSWSAMMRAAARAGVAPAAFWRLSLKEFRWLTEADATGGSMSRAEFEALDRACETLSRRERA